MLLAKVQETAKPLQSHCKENCKATKSYSINGLVCFCFLFLQFCSDRDMYRKNGHLACKNRANGRGGWRAWGWVLQSTAKLQRISSSA
jgi:hypothetical protein